MSAPITHSSLLPIFVTQPPQVSLVYVRYYYIANEHNFVVGSSHYYDKRGLLMGVQPDTTVDALELNRMRLWGIWVQLIPVKGDMIPKRRISDR